MQARNMAILFSIYPRQQQVQTLGVLQMKEKDALASGTYLGGTYLDFQMEQYIHKKEQ